MKPQEWVSWALQSLLLAICAWGVSELSVMSKSIQELNVKVAVMMEKDLSRGVQIDKLDVRVDRLEHKQ